MTPASSETGPRIAPLPEDHWDPRQRELLAMIATGPTQNIYRTIARHPELLDRMTSLGRALRSDLLPAREREIVILRVGWLCRSEYEFAQHRRAAATAGLSETEIERIKSGPDAMGWDPFDSALCRLADELHESGGVSDATWSIVSGRYDEQQLIQVTMLAGYYHLVSFVLNTLGVPLEDGARGFD